jgi:DNA-binding beta-propeller fold protein YncE
MIRSARFLSSGAAVIGCMVALPTAAEASFGPLSPINVISLQNGGRALGEATAATISPDGKNAYVASSRVSNESGVAVFARAPSTGVLSQLPGAAGCVTATGTDGSIDGATCATGHGLRGAHAVAVSPDGKFVYVGSGDDRAVAVFSRDAGTGALTQTSCIGDGSDASCTGVPGLSDLGAVIMSADGHFLYVAAGDGNRVDTFSRDLTTGALLLLQCVEYVTSPTLPAAGCTVARAMKEPEGLVLSPDGHQLYVAASEGGVADNVGALVRFDVSPVTGTLTQPAGAAGCIDATGTDDSAVGGTVCGVGRALRDAHAIAISPDGKSVYMATQGDASRTGSVAAFARNPATGDPTQLAGTEGCVTSNGSDGYTPAPAPVVCAVGRALPEPSGVAVSPDGQSLYVVSGDPQSSLDVFTRNSATGALTQVAGSGGCLSIDGSDGIGSTCAHAAGLAGANGVTVVSGGASATCNYVYVAAQDVNAVSGFARQPDCTVPPNAPLVVTGVASSVSRHGARLSATVNARGNATTYRFDYGPTMAYGAQTLAGAAGAGATAGPASASIAGLQEGAVYHYRIEATSIAGTVFGTDRTFRTALPTKPKPRLLSLKVTPKHPGRPPFTLVARGRLKLPKGVSASSGCGGKVAVAVTHGKTKVATARASVSGHCSYSAQIKVGAGVGTSGSLHVNARYLGSGVLAPIKARAQSVSYP